MPKKKTKKRRKISLYFDEGKLGISVMIVFIAITAGVFLVGGFFNDRKPPTAALEEEAGTAGLCCDSGDGDECKPQEDKKISYDGDDYGLLKSGVKFTEGVYHLEDTGETTEDGDPIIINTSDRYNEAAHSQNAPECTGGDALMAKGVKPNGLPECVVVPNEEIIYVCKKDCTTTPNPVCGMYSARGLTCYGSLTSEYDVYFRLSDYPDPGIPEPIKNCEKETSTQPGALNRQQIIEPSETDRKNLHLNTFRVINPSPVEGATSWVSPWCKPAIYLYPEKQTDIHVAVEPKGTMTYTLPQYPKGGWKVTAYPNGTLSYNNATYPYLYYEAEVPNDAYKKPSEGFIIEKKNLEIKLSEVLKKLGLNDKEKNEFLEYWLKTLPDAPYYFIGIIPPSELDTLAPLSFSPKPQTVIRVTLYFQALDKKIDVKIPQLSTPVRSGFTVVEWGGIFQRDEKHPFSCFM